jgi:hypothetical protein
LEILTERRNLALAMMILDFHGLFHPERHAELFWTSCDCFRPEPSGGAVPMKQAGRAR